MPVTPGKSNKRLLQNQLYFSISSPLRFTENLLDCPLIPGTELVPVARDGRGRLCKAAHSNAQLGVRLFHHPLSTFRQHKYCIKLYHRYLFTIHSVKDPLLLQQRCEPLDYSVLLKEHYKSEKFVKCAQAKLVLVTMTSHQRVMNLGQKY